MKRGLLLSTILTAALPLAAQADNIGQCGWGSKLMEGNSGIAAQVLAVTTNGTSGNQTFGITSGTSGCTQDGVVKSNWKMSMFINENKEKLAKDVSRGSGEALESLASLVGVADQDKDLFFAAAQKNFSKLFPSEQVDSGVVLSSLRDVLRSTPGLEKYEGSVA